MSTDTQAQEFFERHRRLWQQKPVLQRIYKEEFFARLVSFRTPGGISVEVGAGPGFLKQFAPDIFSTDLIWSPWLDAVADAQRLPFRTASVTNIFGLDMLHHVGTPLEFLAEASRILAPGGRLILIEPWITPFSFLVYRFLHQERCDLSEASWTKETHGNSQEKKAFDGNQAIPFLLFGKRHRGATMKSLPELRFLALEPFCFFCYLLSGGFNHTSLLPEFLYAPLAKAEKWAMPLWRRLAALRGLLVLEKGDEEHATSSRLEARRSPTRA
ncbi:MAG TPA: class I SAM-dependent methyltransferase [Candidatus Acidoferrum sp.]|nr:class I SAM-dependent methyltransferase [Candidatus Acidoferrum sp.]